MSTMKVALASTNILLRKNVFVLPNVRNLSICQISNNLDLVSNDKKQRAPNSKFVLPEDKPLVVSLNWLLAKRKTILKYSKLYLDQGYDVLNVSVTPWQILWPVNGSQKVARELLEFLNTHYKQSPLLLHGFSVGAYMWGEAMAQITDEREKYWPIVDRINGQVWDSGADITEIPVGLPFAVFPNNAVMQTALRQYILYHLKTFHKVATTHYIRSSQMFHTNLVKAPALFFVSKSDPVGAVNSNLRVKESWDSMGIPVCWKCWDKSPHVGHFMYHPEEYKEELFTFLNRLSVPNQEKMQVNIRH